MALTVRSLIDCVQIALTVLTASAVLVDSVVLRKNIPNNNLNNNSSSRNSAGTSEDASGTTASVQPRLPPPVTAKQQRWADAAFRYVKTLRCRDVFFTTERQCRYLVRLRSSDVSVYMAESADVYGRLVTVMPDGGLARTGLHDAVVVLDPYPQANFGHLVLVFYVDLVLSEMVCNSRGGTYLGECVIMHVWL